MANEEVVQKNPKDEIQIEALTILWQRGGRGTIATCPGSGKTKIALGFAERIRLIYAKESRPSFSCLLLSFNTVGRDVNFPKELAKWGLKDLEAASENHCIQSVYDWKDRYWDVIIVDEVHNMTSENYSQFFVNNKFRFIVGLSGTLKPETKLILKELKMPVVYSLSLEEGMRRGVVSKFKVINVFLTLSEEKQKEYDFIADSFTNAFKTIGENAFTGLDRAFEISKFGPKELKPIASTIIKQNAARTKFIDTGEQKIEAAIAIRKALPKRKVIVFAATIKQCEEVAKLMNAVYVHSQNNKKKTGNDYSFKVFEEDIYGTLVAVNKVNEVYDLHGISVGVVISGKSSSKNSNQRAGRSVRPQEADIISFMFNLVYKNTIETTWLNIRNKEYSEETIVNVEGLEGALNYIKTYEANHRL